MDTCVRRGLVNVSFVIVGENGVHEFVTAVVYRFIWWLVTCSAGGDADCQRGVDLSA